MRDSIWPKTKPKKPDLSKLSDLPKGTYVLKLIFFVFSQSKKKKKKNRKKKDPNAETSGTGFQILGEQLDKNRNKVVRVLPSWLAKPDFVSVDLSDQQMPVGEMKGNFFRSKCFWLNCHLHFCSCRPFLNNAFLKGDNRNLDAQNPDGILPYRLHEKTSQIQNRALV